MTFVAEGVLAEAYQQHRAIISWPWKYIATADIEEGPKFELYNLREDPREQNSLGIEHLDVTMKLAQTMATSWPYRANRPTFWGRVSGFVRPDTAKDWDTKYREILGYTKGEAAQIKERLHELGYAG